MDGGLEHAQSALETAASVVGAGAAALAAISRASSGKIDVELLDRNQVLAYDLAHAASTVAGGRVMLDYAESNGELESMLAKAYVADAIAELTLRLTGREQLWGVSPGALDPTAAFVQEHRSPEVLEAIADAVAKQGGGSTHLGDDLELARDTFRRFAAEKVRPVAEQVHRENTDIPEPIIRGLAELGLFGLSVPQEYDGFATGSEHDYLAMVVATEELSWGSLGVAGSLITRPEILTRALVRGGTERQKREWLPRIASGEAMVGVMVTEPDYGSDVANLKVTATKAAGGWTISGVKTWATFAGRANTIMLLARTDPDRSKGHKGLSLFIVPKPEATGHSFAFTQEGGGTLEGRAIDTLGYRGMHSFEVAFDTWFVPDENLIGEEGGLGKGFYMQMEGFENGRLQTAARAVGVMQAALDAGLDYARERVVFGKPVFDYQLSKAKIARMAFLVQAGRQFSYAVARRMGKGEGSLEASMVKASVCRAAEWVTRESLQLHGGMGYAEEFPVSRLFVDARVLSIFEGADETLCLRVIARRLAEQALEA